MSLIVFAPMVCLNDVYLRKAMIGVVLNASLNVLLICNMRYCLLIISLASFKVKTKTKWTNKLTHDIVKTFTDLSQHDINKIKTEKVRNPKSNI